MEMYDAVHKVNSRFKKDPRVYGEFVQGGSPALFSITYDSLNLIVGHQLIFSVTPWNIQNVEDSWVNYSTVAKCIN